MSNRSTIQIPHLVLIALVTAVAVVIFSAGATTSASLNPFNSGWDGVSVLQDEASELGTDSRLVTNTDQYGSASPEDSVAFILAPDQAYAADEKRDVETFVRNGGTLVVAEDFGSQGNDILSSIEGVDARFDGRLLRDERYNYRSPAMPIADNGSETVATDSETRLTLNHGTAVDSNGATVGLTTSRVAYLDENRNGDFDQNESIGSFPVVTLERIGGGRVIAVGDPSVFLNTMLDRQDNLVFARNIVRGRHVLIDVSHSESSPPPVAYIVSIVRDSRPIQGIVGVMGVAVILLFARVQRRVRGLLPNSDSGGLPWRPDTEQVDQASIQKTADWRDRRLYNVVLTNTPSGKKEEKDGKD